MVIREKEGCQSELVNARDSSSHFKYCFTLSSCQIGICLVLNWLLTKNMGNRDTMSSEQCHQLGNTCIEIKRLHISAKLLLQWVILVQSMDMNVTRHIHRYLPGYPGPADNVCTNWRSKACLYMTDYILIIGALYWDNKFQNSDNTLNTYLVDWFLSNL